MAQHGARPDDMKAHVSTYDGVINLLKWGTAGSLAVAALVIWLIA